MGCPGKCLPVRPRIRLAGDTNEADTKESATKRTQAWNTERSADRYPLSLAAYGISQREPRNWTGGHICTKFFILGRIHLCGLGLWLVARALAWHT